MARIPVAWLDWLDFRRSLALVVVVAAGYAAYVYRLAHVPGIDRATFVASAVTAAPVAGFLIAPGLIGLAFGLVGYVDERVWAPWQGIHHAFDDHHIWVVEARGVLWFASADVHAALGLRRRAALMRTLRALELHRDPDAGEMLSRAGLVRVFGKSTDRTTLRLLAWAERDVERPWRNERDRSAGAASPAPVEVKS